MLKQFLLAALLALATTPARAAPNFLEAPGTNGFIATSDFIMAELKGAAAVIPGGAIQNRPMLFSQSIGPLAAAGGGWRCSRMAPQAQDQSQE